MISRRTANSNYEVDIVLSLFNQLFKNNQSFTVGIYSDLIATHK